MLSLAPSSDLFLGTIAGTGGSLTVVGKGAVTFQGNTANSFTGALNIQGGNVGFSKTNGGVVLNALTIGDTNAVNSAVVTCFGHNQIGAGVALNMNRSGSINFNGYNNTVYGIILNGSSVATGNGLLTLQGDVSQPLTSVVSSSVSGKLSLGSASRIFDIATNTLDVLAAVSGAAGSGLTKNGNGYLSLHAINSYDGPTVINAGTLRLTGATTNSAFTVNAGALLQLWADTGALTVNGGSLQIDSSNSFYGYLHCPSFTLVNGGTVTMEINGTSPGVNCDQVKVSGPVNLTGGKLACNFYFTPAIGQKFLLIEQTGNNPVSGYFTNLPEGSTFNYNGNFYTISYQGGDGNDVVVTRVSAGALAVLNIPQLSGSQINLTGTGTPNCLFTVQACTNLATAIWADLGTTTSSGGGVISYTDTNAGNFSARFYRLKF